MPARDPLVQRFIDTHSRSVVEEVEDDVREARGLTPAERWAQLCALSRSLGWLAATSPEHQRRVLEWRDEPHPGFRSLVERAREGRPGA